MQKREGLATQPKEIVGCCSENTDSNYWNIFFTYEWIAIIPEWRQAFGYFVK